MTATDIGQIEVPDDDANLWRGRVEDSRDDDAPTDMSINHDKYLGEILEAEHNAL